METGKGTVIVALFFALETHKKSRWGSLLYIQNLFLSVCVSTVEKKRERGKPSSKNPCLSRVNTISIYIVENSIVLCSALKTVFLYIYWSLGSPFSFPFFACPISATTKGRMFVSKSKRNMQPILCSWDFSPSFSSSFPFLTLIPGSMAQHSVILSKLSPNFHAMRHSPKHIPTFDTINGRDETRKKKQVQPQFSFFYFSILKWNLKKKKERRKKQHVYYLLWALCWASIKL